MVLIDGIIDERLSTKNLQDDAKNRGSEFESFAFSEILKPFDLTEKELENGIVDGSDDGGIDGFYIFVNGVPIIDSSDFTWPKRNAELEVYIITCKHHDTYELGPLESLDSSLSEIFDLRLATSEFKSKLNARILKKRKSLIETYRKVAHILTKCSINIIYTSRGDSSQVAADIVAKGRKIENTCRTLFLDCDVKTLFWGASELIMQYRKKRNAPVILNTIKCFQNKTDFVALVSLDDYFQFVTDENRKLKRFYFEENVRDFLGGNRTNTDIYCTLADQKSPDFWLLNNGITILVSKAVLYDGQLEIENVQIVNGLQTTNTIYQYYSNGRADKAGRCLLVKIICSTEESIRNQIIQATNNQSAIPLYSLHATDKMQKDIEMVMLQHGLYYERKTNYYRNLGYDEQKIFAPLYLAGGFIALILKLPHRAATLKSRFMNNPMEYQRVFSNSSDLRVWPQIAGILRRVDAAAERNRVRVKTSTEKYLKTIRPLISILCVSKVVGKFGFGERDLVNLDIELLSQATISLVVNDIVTLINNDQTIRSIKDIARREKMNEIVESIGQKYQLTDFKSIQRRPDISLDGDEITKDFLEKVKQELPTQPWPVGIHRIVAARLGCTPSKVYRSIDILIEDGTFRNQVDGILS